MYQYIHGKCTMLKTYGRSFILPNEYIDKCRFCLGSDALVSLLDIPDIKTILLRNTGLRISKDDGLPAKACEKCYNLLFELDKFKTMCLTSYVKLREIRIQPNNKVEEVIKIEEPEKIIDLVQCDRLLLEEENVYPEAPDEVMMQIKKTIETETDTLHPAYSLSCSTCNTNCSNLSELSIHSKKMHNTIRYYCHHCAKPFRLKSMLARHMLIHLGIKPFSCNICNRKFGQKVTALRHAETHKDRSYPCLLCPKILCTQQGLDSHITTQHSPKDPSAKLQCDMCERTFCHSSGLSRHKSASHKSNFVTCYICMKTFCDKSSLVRHCKRIHGNN